MSRTASSDRHCLWPSHAGLWMHSGETKMEIWFGDYTLRSWSWDDAPALVRYANNRSVWINVLDAFPHPYTRADAEAWLDRVVDQERPTSFAIATKSEAIGGMGVTLKDDVRSNTAEIGFWLAEPFWGKGIATDAVRVVVDYAFSNFDLTRVEAYVFEWNLAPCRVLEKAGFVQEARLRRRATKDGKTIDEFLYALVREEA